MIENKQKKKHLLPIIYSNILAVFPLSYFGVTAYLDGENEKAIIFLVVILIEIITAFVLFVNYKISQEEGE